MIQNNLCDLEGMVFQVQEKEYEEHFTTMFNLSVPDSYLDNTGKRHTRWDSIFCTYSKKKGNARNEAKYNWLKANLKEQAIIRIQGKLTSWKDSVDDNTYTRHVIRLKDFKLIKKSTLSQEQEKEQDYNKVESKQSNVIKQKELNDLDDELSNMVDPTEVDDYRYTMDFGH